MAESHSGFDAIAALPVDSIREALRRTMALGMPVDTRHQPTFHFEREVDFARHDQEGSPWDWTASPVTQVLGRSVQVLCAYEFFSPLGRQGSFPTEVGDFNPTTLVFTLFEDEFAQVEGFTYATVGPSDQRWYFRFWRPAYGLGDMSVYQIHTVAEGVL